MGNGSRFSPEVKERAVRLVFKEVMGDAPTWRAIVSVASKIGCTAETLRRWVRQAERDVGKGEGLTMDERAELKKANEILPLASAFFAQAELDRRK